MDQELRELHEMQERYKHSNYAPLLNPLNSTDSRNRTGQIPGPSTTHREIPDSYLLIHTVDSHYSFSATIRVFLRSNRVDNESFLALQSALDHDEWEWAALFIEAGLEANIASTLHDMILAEYPRDLVQLMVSLRFSDGDDVDEFSRCTSITDNAIYDVSSVSSPTESSISDTLVQIL